MIHLLKRELMGNPAHIAVAKLEQVLCDPMPIQFVKAFNYQSDWESHWLLNSHQPLTLITQNVDDLHQRAGSGNVITMHGQLRYLRCLNCNTLLESLVDKDLTDQFIDCLICQDSQSILRQHVVWFGGNSVWPFSY